MIIVGPAGKFGWLKWGFKVGRPIDGIEMELLEFLWRFGPTKKIRDWALDRYVSYL